MDTWAAAAVPDLPGRGQVLQLHDTASGSVRPTAPDRLARMYVCGITPYDATHLGHAATYLAFDLVRRVWHDAGHEVNYVQNVTDIDDPLLERAARTGENWMALAEREIQLYREDMGALAVLPPHQLIGAVEAIPEITAAIGELLDKGAAYLLHDDIYFPVSAAPDFGSESHYDRSTMLELFGERGGDPQRHGKRDPLDSVLWRGRRPGEPFWDTPLGPGRPGWHIECTVIAMNRLGRGFDVQGGGSDLIFPHHEHTAAHAEALTDSTPFAKSYVHAGMIGLDGEKMSKSRGNLVLVSKLRAAGVDPMAIRLALLDGHYRADREWTGGRLKRAEARLDRWRAAVDLTGTPPADALLAEVRAALADDLDTSAALAAMDRWADTALAVDTGSGGSSGGGSGNARGDSRTGDTVASGVAADAVDALLGVRLPRS